MLVQVWARRSITILEKAGTKAVLCLALTARYVMLELRKERRVEDTMSRLTWPDDESPSKTASKPVWVLDMLMLIRSMAVWRSSLDGNLKSKITSSCRPQPQ